MNDLKKDEPQTESDQHPHDLPRDTDDSSKNQEPRSSKKWSHFPLYLILAAFLVFSLAHYGFQEMRKTRLRFMDLVRLIEQGAPDKNPEAEIFVTEETGDTRKVTRFWDLRNIVVGPERIRGQVRFEVVSEEKISKDEQKPADGEKTPAETAESSEKKETPAVKSEKSEKMPEPVAFVTNRYGMREDNGFLIRLLADNGFDDVDAENTPGILQSLLHMIPFLVFFGILFYFMVTRFGNAGAVAFGRNRGRFYERDELGVTFEDVAGVDEAVNELREVVDFLKSPEKFRALGGKIPRGILLVGPPGTGKTLLGKAVAGEADVPFLSLSGSDFVEMYVGVGAARVRSMFQEAMAHAPCIVFIDELDALGKARSSGGPGSNDEREQTLNALLVEMDGFTPNSGVIVLAATNRPEMLDPALLRPGRFDRQVLVDRPDKVGREKILRVHAAEVKLAAEVNLTEVAAMTAGFVGADLANLMNEAALLAARQGKSEITMSELNEGVERITAGLEKRSRVLSEKVKHRVAVHESAHALVAHLMPDASQVHKISIIPRGLAALGYTMQRPEEDRYLVTREELETEICVLIAGTIGEELVFQTISTGASNDLQRATEIARSIVMDYGMSGLGRITFRDRPRNNMLGVEDFAPREFSETTAREIDQEIRRIIETGETRVREILQSRRNTLDAIAQRLLLEEVIDAETLKRIVDGPAESSE